MNKKNLLHPYIRAASTGPAGRFSTRGCKFRVAISVVLSESILGRLGECRPTTLAGSSRKSLLYSARAKLSRRKCAHQTDTSPVRPPMFPLLLFFSSGERSDFFLPLFARRGSGRSIFSRVLIREERERENWAVLRNLSCCFPCVFKAKKKL